MVKVYLIKSLIPIFCALGHEISDLVSEPGEAEVICYFIFERFSEHDGEYLAIKRLLSPDVHLVIIVENDQDRNLIPLDLVYDYCYNIRNKKFDELIEKLNADSWYCPTRESEIKCLEETPEERVNQESRNRSRGTEVGDTGELHEVRIYIGVASYLRLVNEAYLLAEQQKLEKEKKSGSQ